MKKVLIFLPVIDANGISKIVSDWLNCFTDEISVDIATFKIIDDIYYKNCKYDIKLINGRKNILKRLINEYRIFNSKSYDVVHINGNNFLRIIECFISKIVGIKKIIIHSHNTGTKKNIFLSRFINNCLKKFFDFIATDYFACSDEAAKWMFSKKIYDNNHYKVINNGICVEKFKYNEKIRNDLRKLLNISEETLCIGFVGRLCYQKNPLFLLDILNEYKKNNNNVLLIIIGTGELYSKMLEKIKKLELEKNVIFIGNVCNVNDYYNVMDCFILPSAYEGFGIVAIEAQTSGLNTLLSDRVPRLTKVISNTKYISLDCSSEKWASYIKKSLNRNDKYNYTIEKNFDIYSVCLMLESFYKSSD